MTGVTHRAEEEGIHDREWASPHREDVAQDAPDTRGGTLVGLNGRGVVVTLNANRHRNTVTGINYSGVFTGSDQDAVPFGGQTTQVYARRLIGAVLTPHNAVEGQFEGVGLTLQNCADVLQL